MDENLKARVAAKLALPKTRSPKKVTAVEVARSFFKEVEATRRTGKTWAAIAEDVAEIGTFSSHALRQGFSSTTRAKASAASSKTSANRKIRRKPSLRAARIRTDTASLAAPSAFSNAFKTRTDDLSDLKGGA